MNLTPQEQFVTGILAISTIPTIGALTSVFQKLKEKGYSIANIPAKYTDLKYIVNRLRRDGMVDDYMQVTEKGLKEIDNLKFPVRIVIHLYQQFGQYESKF